jgi:hypothetical protein
MTCIDQIPHKTNLFLHGSWNLPVYFEGKRCYLNPVQISRLFALVVQGLPIILGNKNHANIYE